MTYEVVYRSTVKGFAYYKTDSFFEKSVTKFTPFVNINFHLLKNEENNYKIECVIINSNRKSDINNSRATTANLTNKNIVSGNIYIQIPEMIMEIGHYFSTIPNTKKYQQNQLPNINDSYTAYNTNVFLDTLNDKTPHKRNTFCLDKSTKTSKVQFTSLDNCDVNKSDQFKELGSLDQLFFKFKYNKDMYKLTIDDISIGITMEKNGRQRFKGLIPITTKMVNK